MASDWKETSLGAEVDMLTGFPFRSERYTDFDDGIRLVRGDNIIQGAMRWDGVKKWPASESAEHDLFKLREGDVVLAMDRPWIEAGLKYAAISKHDLPCLLVQRTARLRGGPMLDTGFLRYLIGSREFTQHIHAITTGTAVPHISGNQIKDFTFARPSLAEQKGIASALGALDEKIELNRRMNATLEAIARALFQSWFVDFAPVRAKLDGRRPIGLDKTTAALFPETFGVSNVGRVPKGWAFGKVADLATFSRGAINPGDFPTETFDHFSLPAFDAGRTPKAELGSAIMSNKLVVTPNSVLLSKLNPHIPRIWLPDLHPTRRSVCSTEFMVACSKSDMSREYLFSLFTSSAFASIYGTLVTGTTGSHQRIRPEGIQEMKVVIPPGTLIQAFTALAKPMFDRINRNTDQSKTLRTLRDTLLPKLLSGELSVPSISGF
jgi:type I restriction enzyme S subunit